MTQLQNQLDGMHVDRRDKRERGKGEEKRRNVFCFIDVCVQVQLMCVCLMQTDLNRKYRMHDRMDRVHAGPFMQARSILSRISVKKGRYLLVPSTFDQGQEGLFLLRLYTSGTIETKYASLYSMLFDWFEEKRMYIDQ